MPYIPGGEFAGVVEGDSGQDADFDDGTPVYGYPGLTGCYAQYVVCPVEQMAPLPAGLPITDAAGVPVNGMTAIQGLTDVLGISRGDQVLVTAAAGGLGHFAVQIARVLGASVVATASPQHHEFVHHLGAAVVVDHTQPSWPDQVRDVIDGGAQHVLACAAPTLEGAARAARDGATIATPVHAEYPDAQRVSWRPYNGQPRGSQLIRMAPWFDDGLMSVNVEARYYYEDAAAGAPPGRRGAHPRQARPRRGRRPGRRTGDLSGEVSATRRSGSAGRGPVPRAAHPRPSPARSLLFPPGTALTR